MGEGWAVEGLLKMTVFPSGSVNAIVQDLTSCCYCSIQPLCGIVLAANVQSYVHEPRYKIIQNNDPGHVDWS